MRTAISPSATETLIWIFSLAPRESIVWQHAKRGESHCHAIAGFVSGSISIRFGPGNYDRDARHFLGGVNGNLVERGLGLRLPTMREIESNVQALISSHKANFLDHAVGQSPASFG